MITTRTTMFVPAFICIDLLISRVLKINDDADDDDDDEEEEEEEERL